MLYIACNIASESSKKLARYYDDLAKKGANISRPSVQNRKMELETESANCRNNILYFLLG